jgi:hypothetical protein
MILSVINVSWIKLSIPCLRGFWFAFDSIVQRACLVIWGVRCFPRTQEKKKEREREEVLLDCTTSLLKALWKRCSCCTLVCLSWVSRVSGSFFSALLFEWVSEWVSWVELRWVSCHWTFKFLSVPWSCYCCPRTSAKRPAQNTEHSQETYTEQQRNEERTIKQHTLHQGGVVKKITISLITSSIYFHINLSIIILRSYLCPLLHSSF